MMKDELISHSSRMNVSIAKELIYDKCGFNFSDFQPEIESKAYEACRFRLNGLQVIHRSARITPKKVGQFVVLWKRSAAGIIIPFDVSDAFEFVVITTRDKDFFGQFIFPKTVLEAKEIISSLKDGKRGIRVYPPWEVAINKQAQKTQQWQSDYFLDIPSGGETIDIRKAVTLFKRN